MSDEAMVVLLREALRVALGESHRMTMPEVRALLAQVTREANYSVFECNNLVTIWRHDGNV